MNRPEAQLDLDLHPFLRDAEAFVEAAAPQFAVDPNDGPRRYGLFPDLTPEEEEQELRLARAWRAHRFDAGFGWISGPPEYGGRGLPPSYEREYLRVERRYTFPPQRIFDISVGMVAPMTLQYGTPQVRLRYLQALHRGDTVGCQLFSEPGAGSDLASISTRAVREDDGWRIDGQKVWSSGAHLSEVGLLVCRTGLPDARHRNLTAFLLPMTTPGVTVRPLRQMTGGSSFNEVFLTSVWIPDEFRLGEVDAGWDVVVSTLLHERAAVGGPSAGGGGILRTQRLVELLNRFGRGHDGAVRARLMKFHCSLTVARLTRRRAEAKVRAGQQPGPEMSIGKLALTKNLAEMAHLLGIALGPCLVADNGEADTYAWAEFVLSVPGLRIGGGTDEIQRNILAERVLGLPR